MAAKKKKDPQVEALEKLGDALQYFGALFMEGAAALKTFMEDASNIVEDEKKTDTPPPKDKDRKVFTHAECPKSPGERKLHEKHWAKLGTEGQVKYIDGYINSLGEMIKEEPVNEEDGFGDLDDLGDDINATETKYELSDVREAAKNRAKADGNKSTVVAVFKKYGCKKIDDAQEKDFAGIIADLA